MAKSRAVCEMFASISGRYDFLNHFLSGNIDKRWREECLRQVEKRVTENRPLILDVGCGTADLALTFARLGPVVGCDFCRPMLCIGSRKVRRAEKSGDIALIEGDALSLPFADATFDVVASAFVLRNLANLETGFEEMKRVLRRGGVLAVLDFSLPEVRFAAKLYRFYFTRILPRLGKWISGVDGPYRYLPDSVRTFPKPEALKQLIGEIGFRDAVSYSLTGGIAMLLMAKTPP